MKYIFCLLLLVLSMSVNAQVAINTDNSAPDASSMLDVKSTNKGLLVPRMTQAQRTAITTPASGLLVYQTDNPSGFYYYSGAGWFRLSLQNEGWSTTGNTGTNPTNNFIGTIDNQSLSFRLNNSPAGKFDHISDNYFLGYGSGVSIGSGLHNIGIGSYALKNNWASSFNIAIGDSALFSDENSLGENVAIGAKSLLHNWDGFNNTALGTYSLYYNTTGWYNTASGYKTLYANTTGTANTANGAFSLYSNSTGNYNTASGYQTLSINSTGNLNTGTGAFALANNTDGNYNTANGYESLYNNNGGYSNTASGYWSLRYNTIGNNNTGIGVFALTYNTEGDENTAVGYYSLSSNETGGLNTAIGTNSLVSINTGNYNTAIGNAAGASLPGNVNNVTALGSSSGFTTTPDNHVNIGSIYSTWIGGQVNWAVWSDNKIKKNIREDVAGLSFIMQLKPVTYNLNVHKQSDKVYTPGSDTLFWPSKYEIETITQSGFIAQEVEQAAKSANYNFSGVVAPKSEEGLYSLRYAEFVVPLVKAVQELSQSNDEQQAFIEKQQQKIEELEKAIKNLSHEDK